jgi:hypothetical protein
MKHKYLTVLAAFPLLSFTGTAFAATVVNSNTGAESENFAHATIERDVKVENSNKADVNNDVELYLSTGNNEIGSGKITSGSQDAIFGHGSKDFGFDERSGKIDTGDASADIKVENKLNENKTLICEGKEACEVKEEEKPSGMGGGPQEEVTPTVSEPAPEGAGMGAGPSELAGAGNNSALAAVPLTLATLAMLYLARIRKNSTFTN